MMIEQHSHIQTHTFHSVYVSQNWSMVNDGVGVQSLSVEGVNGMFRIFEKKKKIVTNVTKRFK